MRPFSLPCVETRNREQQHLLASLKNVVLLNFRQRMFITRLLKNPDRSTNAAAYSKEYQVAKQTALTDLGELVKPGLLSVTKIMRVFVYTPVPDLEQRAMSL